MDGITRDLTAQVEPRLVPIPEELEADYGPESDFGIAEFESVRPSSPEDSGADEGMDNESCQSLEYEDPPNFHSGDQGNGNAASSPEDDQNNRSPDPELDSAILGNDQLAYDLAHDNNGPWNSPGADEQSAQLFLSELTDHQRAVIRILAHRQVDQMFKRLGFSDIDPESDVYREQYNLIVTMMVGGGMILGHPQEATAPSVTHQDHVDPYDGQHRRLVERIERGNRTDRVKSFDFSRVSDQNESPVLQEPPMMKEEEVTPLLSNGTAPPPVTETVQPVVTTRSSMPVAPTSVNDGTTRNAHQREPRIGKTLKDKVILQRWRNKDIKRYRSHRYC